MLDDLAGRFGALGVDRALGLVSGVRSSGSDALAPVRSAPLLAGRRRAAQAGSPVARSGHSLLGGLVARHQQHRRNSAIAAIIRIAHSPSRNRARHSSFVSPQ